MEYPFDDGHKKRIAVSWSDHQPLLWLFASLALGILIPSGQSLWIDEGFSAQYAAPMSVSEFVDRLAHEQGSEALMPLGMASTWVGARLFGRSELGLRMVSTVWAGVAVLIMWKVGVLVGMPWMAVVFACHPFLWYYGGEARPYAMVIAMGAGILWALVSAVSLNGAGSKELNSFLLFGLLLCGVSILGVLTAVVSAVVFFGFVAKGTIGWVRNRLIAVSISASALFLVGAYYLWALARGAETAWKGPWSFSFGSLLFSAYELMGFVGFGPGRFELRQLAIEGGIGGALRGSLRVTMLGAILLLLIYCWILWSFWIRQKSDGSRFLRPVFYALCVVAVTTASAMIVSYVSATPFWGRHLAAVFPMIAFSIVCAAGSRSRGTSRGPAAVTILLMGLLLASSLLVRFSPEHARDDYRGAARLAVSAVNAGEEVWWVADPGVARYYGLSLRREANSGTEGSALLASGGEPGWLESLPSPDLIVLSKPELFDTAADVRMYVARHRYQLMRELMAFQVFVPQGAR